MQRKQINKITQARNASGLEDSLALEPVGVLENIVCSLVEQHGENVPTMI